jgi:hypothetical protein
LGGNEDGRADEENTRAHRNIRISEAADVPEAASDLIAFHLPAHAADPSPEEPVPETPQDLTATPALVTHDRDRIEAPRARDNRTEVLKKAR